MESDSDRIEKNSGSHLARWRVFENRPPYDKGVFWVCVTLKAMPNAYIAANNARKTKLPTRI